MLKAMPLLEERDKKLIDVARSVGYESDAAFSKAFKRVVGASPGEFLKRGFRDQDRPVAITRHGDSAGYSTPARRKRRDAE